MNVATYESPTLYKLSVVFESLLGLSFCKVIGTHLGCGTLYNGKSSSVVELVDHDDLIVSLLVRNR